MRPRALLLGTLGLLVARPAGAQEPMRIQPVRAITSQQTAKPNVMVVVDSSGSMARAPWDGCSVGNDCRNGVNCSISDAACMCPPGYTHDATADTCSACPDGYTLTGTTCVTCPGGAFPHAGSCGSCPTNTVFDDGKCCPSAYPNYRSGCGCDNNSSGSCPGGAGSNPTAVTPSSSVPQEVLPQGSRTSSRLAVVKDALKTLLPQIKDTVNLGLMTYYQTGYSRYYTEGWSGWREATPTGTDPCPDNHWVQYALDDYDSTSQYYREYAFTLCRSSAGDALTPSGTTPPGIAPDSVLRLYDGSGSYLSVEADDTTDTAGQVNTVVGLNQYCQAQGGGAMAASTVRYDPPSDMTVRICVTGKTATSDGEGTLAVLEKQPRYFTDRDFFAVVPGFDPDSNESTAPTTSVATPASIPPAAATFGGYGLCSLGTIGGKQARWRRVGSTTTISRNFSEMNSCAWVDMNASGSSALDEFNLRCRVIGSTTEYYLYEVAYRCWTTLNTYTVGRPSEERAFSSLDEGTPYVSRGASFTIDSGTDQGTWTFMSLAEQLSSVSAANRGRVIAQIEPALDAAGRQQKVDHMLEWMADGALGGLVADGFTPIGKTLSDTATGATPATSAYHYFQCLAKPGCTSLPSYCSDSGITCDTDGASCRDNYIILLTDGEPNPDSCSTSDGCLTNPSGCSCKAVKAAYNLRNGSPSVKTFAVGFGAEMTGATAQNTLRNIAAAGGTCRNGSTDFEQCAYAAGDEATLVAKLREAFNEIALQFSTSPVATATGERTTVAANYALLTFTKYPSWEGDLIAYDLLSPDPTGVTPEHFSAGTLLKTKEWCHRKAFTWNVTSADITDQPDNAAGGTTYPPNTAIPLSTWTTGACSEGHANGQALVNLVARMKADGTVPTGFNFPTSAIQAREMIRFILGDPTESHYSKPAGAPHWKLGPILHATPVAVGPSPEDPARFADRPAVAYVGTTYGLLHGFWLQSGTDRTAGDEVLAFAPPRLLERMYAIFSNGGQPAEEEDHYWGIASSAHVSDVCVADCTTSPTWRTLLFFGLGAGGPAYYALDVTHVTDTDDTPLATPYCTTTGNTRCVGLRWSTDDKVDYGGIRSDNDLTDDYGPLLGQSWSVPAISDIDGTRVLVVGSGYGASGTQGEHFMAISARTGTLRESRRIAAPASPVVAYGLVGDIALAKFDPTLVTENPQWAVIGDPAGRVSLWDPVIDGSDSNPAPTLMADFGTSKPILYSPAVFLKEAGANDELVIAGATSSYDFPDGSPETYLFILTRTGTGAVQEIVSNLAGGGKKISDFCKTSFRRDLSAGDYCTNAANHFRNTARIVASPKLLINSSTPGVQCTTAEAQNSGACVLQAAYPIYEPPASGCQAGNSYLVVLEAILDPSVKAEHAMTINLGEALRSSGFTVGAGGQSLVVGGREGVTSVVRSGEGLSNFSGTRRIGWREL